MEQRAKPREASLPQAPCMNSCAFHMSSLTAILIPLSPGEGKGDLFQIQVWEKWEGEMKL